MIISLGNNQNTIQEKLYTNNDYQMIDETTNKQFEFCFPNGHRQFSDDSMGMKAVNLEKITPYKLCMMLNQKNKALMGRIVALIDHAILNSILAEIEYRQKQGIVENKATYFIKVIKEYIKANCPDKIKLIFNKRIKSFYPQHVTYINDMETYF